MHNFSTINRFGVYAILLLLLIGARPQSQTNTAPQAAEAPTDSYTALLVGSWSLKHQELYITHTLKSSIEKRFIKRRQSLDSLNTLLENGVDKIRVEFNVDGSFQLKHTGGQHMQSFEQGTWSLKGRTLSARSSTHAERSSLDGARITRLTNESLSLVYRAFAEKDGVMQSVEFSRIHK